MPSASTHGSAGHSSASFPNTRCGRGAGSAAPASTIANYEEKAMFDSVRVARGVVRSLRIYYGDRERRAALDRHYARFVASGDLVFDIGSHVGDRVAAFRR